MPSDHPGPLNFASDYRGHINANVLSESDRVSWSGSSYVPEVQAQRSVINHGDHCHRLCTNSSAEFSCCARYSSNQLTLLVKGCSLYLPASYPLAQNTLAKTH